VQASVFLLLFLSTIPRSQLGNRARDLPTAVFVAIDGSLGNAPLFGGFLIGPAQTVEDGSEFGGGQRCLQVLRARI
jgi:hypothetical protein